ncbi:MAG: hypothetical protein HY880_09020 [Deltaproteobacteria bacterium]|nr:hypothetical protein [Deltaproteobacteria bacterium]
MTRDEEENMTTNIFSENKALMEKEYAERKVVLSSYPTILNLPVSERCNLKCFMCPVSVDTDAFRIYLAPQAYRKIEALYPYLELLELDGAEAFTVKEGTGHIVDSIIEASQRYPDMKLAALTNGQLIGEKRAEAIVNKFGILNISIDTPDPVVYGSIRIGGRLDTLINNIARINQLKKDMGRSRFDPPKLQFSALIMERTYRDLPKLVRLIAELGGIHFSFQALRKEVPDAYWEGFKTEHIFEDRKKVEEYLSIVNEAKKTASELGITTIDRTRSYVRMFWPDLATDEIADKKTAAAKNEARPSIPVCKFAYRNIFIWPRSDVTFSCCSKRVIGDINKQTIEEIRNSHAAIDERKRFIAGDYENCNINCQMSYPFAGKSIK